MLAYVFWHRPGKNVDRRRYENALRQFHATLDVPSTTFRLRRLPFADVDGYEDWYLVEDWQDLGALNVRAVDERRRESHDCAAAMAMESWGGIYGLLRGPAVPPPVASWRAKPSEQSYGEFLNSLTCPTIWQRQMVLGPAPEFCLGENDSGDRQEL